MLHRGSFKCDDGVPGCNHSQMKPEYICDSLVAIAAHEPPFLPHRSHYQEMIEQGGIMAMVDSGGTFTCFAQPVGKVSDTHSSSNISVTLGGGSTFSFPGTDLYSVEVGGQGSITYDVLCRASTYPPGTDDGSVISEIILKTFFNSRSTPEGGLSYFIGFSSFIAHHCS